VNKGLDLEFLDKEAVQELIAKVTKDHTNVQQRENWLVEQQEGESTEQNLLDLLDLEWRHREILDLQKTYARRLQAVGEKKNVSSAHRLGATIADLVRFQKRSIKRDKVRRKSQQAPSGRVSSPRDTPSPMPRPAWSPSTARPARPVRSMSDDKNAALERQLQELRADNQAVVADLERQLHDLGVDNLKNEKTISDLNEDLGRRPPPVPAGQIEGLRREVDQAFAELRQVADALNERVVSVVIDTPIAGAAQPAALNERRCVTKALARELKSDKERLFDPSLEACDSLIKRLKDSGVDTSVYEESLEHGNVGAVLTVELILRSVVARLEETEAQLDPRLIGRLSELEAEVTQKVVDIRLRVVPMGLIRFCRDLMSDATGSAEVQARERTVEKIIDLVEQYVI
jgi:hypothetical protein